MEPIIQLISNLGFPIACVIACGYYIMQMTKQAREDTKAREERLYSQLDKFSTSLNNFNTTLIRIDARVGVIEDKLK